MRVKDIGTDGFTQDYDGYDMLVFANLSSQPIANPMLGVGGGLSPAVSWTASTPASSSNPIFGSGGVLNPLLIGGYANNPEFGGSGPQQLTQLAPGQIYVTLVPQTSQWFDAAGTAADGQHMSIVADLQDQQLTYMVDAGKAASPQATVDQVFNPQGPSLSGVTWQSLGTDTSSTGTVRVTISNPGTGSAAADGVELVRQGSVLPGLLQLNLQGDPLGNDARNIQIGTLASEVQANAAAAAPTTIPETVLYNADANPPTLAAQGGISLPSGQSSTTVTLSASDPDKGDSITFSAQSGDPHVTVSVSGNVVTLSPNQPGFNGTVPILITATDSNGRTVRESFDFNVGVGAIYGSLTQTSNSNPQDLEGARVFLDENGNGVLDPGEPTTITDASGHYSFTDLPPGTATVVEVVPIGWVATAPIGDTASLVASPYPGKNTASSNPSSLVSFGSAVYFVASDGLTGEQLYRYDGTKLTRITNINPGPSAPPSEN